MSNLFNASLDIGNERVHNNSFDRWIMTHSLERYPGSSPRHDHNESTVKLRRFSGVSLYYSIICEIMSRRGRKPKMPQPHHLREHLLGFPPVSLADMELGVTAKTLRELQRKHQVCNNALFVVRSEMISRLQRFQTDFLRFITPCWRTNNVICI